MNEFDTLRAWRNLLSRGPATITIEVDGVRYTIPHARCELVFEADVREVVGD